jgi:hypothetical protein
MVGLGRAFLCCLSRLPHQHIIVQARQAYSRAGGTGPPTALIADWIFGVPLVCCLDQCGGALESVNILI